MKPALRSTTLLFALALLWPSISLAREGVLQVTGKAVGYVAGIAVTGALALSKKWNMPLLGANGKPELLRVGGRAFELRTRHAPVLGPKLLADAKAMPRATRLERAEHSLVLGLGEGAAKAPRAEAKMEATIAAALHR